MAVRERETVLASVWAENCEIAMVLFKKSGETYTPLAYWKSNLSVFNFGFAEVLEEWQAAHGLNKVQINQPVTYTGDLRKHPILKLMPASTTAEMVERIEPIEGLANLHYGIQQNTIDFSHYSKNRLLEQIKRLDEKRDPVVLAFLQGISNKGSPGLVFG